jgi:hypothetical protein
MSDFEKRLENFSKKRYNLEQLQKRINLVKFPKCSQCDYWMKKSSCSREKDHLVNCEEIPCVIFKESNDFKKFKLETEKLLTLET